MITKTKKVGFNYFLLLAIPLMLAQGLMFLKPVAYPKAIEGTFESEIEESQKSEDSKAYDEDEAMNLWYSVEYLGKEEGNINELLNDFGQEDYFFLTGFWAFIGLMIMVLGAFIGVIYVLLIPAGMKLQRKLAGLNRAASIIMLFGELGVAIESSKIKSALIRVRDGQVKELGYSFLLDFKPLGFTPLYFILLALLAVNIIIVSSLIANFTYKEKEFVPKTAGEEFIPKLAVPNVRANEAATFDKVEKSIEEDFDYDKLK